MRSKWPRAPGSNPPGVKRSTGEGAGRAGGTLVRAARLAPGRTVGAALGTCAAQGCVAGPCRRPVGDCEVGSEAPGEDPGVRGCAAVLAADYCRGRGHQVRVPSSHAAGARGGKPVQSPSQSRAGRGSGAVEALGGTRTTFSLAPGVVRARGSWGLPAGAVVPGVSSASRKWKSRWVHGWLGEAQDGFVGTALRLNAVLKQQCLNPTIAGEGWSCK